MYLWPWLPVNYLPVLSLGNDAPAEESCLRAQCVLRTQSLRAINNWVGLEPCTSWGFGLPDGTDPSRRGLVVQKLNVFHGGNHAVHFSWFSGWFLLQQVISGSSEAIAATEISTASIKLQDGFTLFFFFFFAQGYLFSSSASKPKHCFCLFDAKTQDQSRIRWAVQKRLIQKTVLGHLRYNQCPDWFTDTCFYFRDMFACQSASTHKCDVKQGSHFLCTANV